MFQKIFNSGSHLSLSIVLSTGSFLLHSHVETRKQQREQKRTKINNKIKDLYGPIVGNRILHRSAIRALENHYQKPLIEVITDVCKRRNSEELENWRCFYIKMLAPLGRVLMFKQDFIIPVLRWRLEVNYRKKLTFGKAQRWPGQVRINNGGNCCSPVPHGNLAAYWR